MIRHVDQLLKTDCKRQESDDDWRDTINTEKPSEQSVSSRYPQRIRKAVDRYEA